MHGHCTAGGPDMSLAERRAQAAEKERLLRLEERGKRVQFKVLLSTP